MSTRRTTRATSRAASSRGASPAVTENDIQATPSGRRTRRASSLAPLQPVASRSSTAYGTNTTIQPTSLKVPESGEEINSALHSILQPQSTLPVVQEEDNLSEAGHSRGGRGGHRLGRGAFDNYVVDRSYGNESHIFGQADIESSRASPSELLESSPTPVRPSNLSFRKSTAEEERIKKLASKEREEMRRQNARTQADRAREQAEVARESFWQMKSRYVEESLDVAARFYTLLRSVWSWMKNNLGKILTVAGLLVLFLLSSSGPYRFYGLDLKHNVGQFVPNFVAHPISSFSPSEINDLQTRMSSVEYDIAYLKKRRGVDEEAIAHLKQILPEKIIVKRTKNGNLEITQEFWHALDAKMRSENAYYRPEATMKKSSKDSPTTDILLAQVETVMEKSKIWDRFLHNNRAQLKEWAGEEFDARFPDHFKKSILLNKSEFIELVRHNWEDAQDDIKKELRKLSKRLDDAVEHFGKSDDGIVGHTREQIKSISTDVFRSLFNTAQLEALAKANKGINAAAHEHRLNHFSPATGAMINPKLTSPNYLFPAMDRSFFIKGLSWVLWKKIPTPNPPEVALQKWEEHGDCWCALSKDSDGFGPSLAVITANQIYPDQVVIEHVAPSGSLEPGAAPRDMEILAYIEDRETYHIVKKRSDEIFYEEAELDEPQPFGFVRIATWTYEANHPSNIQSIPTQIDLATFRGKAYTNRLVVRAKNNWGAEFTCLYRVRVHGEIAH